jgi:hypothetical protein
MLVFVLNGWSASSRARGGHIATVVRRVVPDGTAVYAATARLGGWQARRVRKRLLKHQSPDTTLLLVGKSLGGWDMLVGVVNRCRLRYRRIALVTVDPCHPRLWDWAPDRSSDVLPLHSGRVDLCVNLLQHNARPCGAHVDGAIEVQVPNVDHFSITRSKAVEHWLRHAVDELDGPRPGSSVPV